MQNKENVGTREDLAAYRIQLSKNDLRSAKILLESNDCRGANNRAYYAIFHAINAVHGLNGKSYKKHKDALGNFNKEYVKTEIFPKDIGRKIDVARKIRDSSDYDDFYVVSIKDTEEQIALAEELIKLVEDYCKKYVRTL